MPREIVLIPKEAPSKHFIYLAVLAYPESQKKREDFTDACMALIYKTSYKRKERAMREIPKQYRRMKTTTVESTVRAGMNRIRKERFYAAFYVFTHVFQREKSNDKTMLLDEKWTDTRSHAAYHFFENIKGEYRDCIKVRNRYWKNSKPVLHLAMAILNRLWHSEDAGEDFNNLIVDSSWVPDALEEAEAWRHILLEHFKDLTEQKTFRINLI